MAELDHWNPVLRSADLRDKPIGIRLAGKEIVLFRTKTGVAGALRDVCVHRRMRLSCGKVCGESLVCGYHGWSFKTDGAAESPGTPKLRAQAESFEVREEQGLLWIKPTNCAAEFPRFATEGFDHISTSEHEASVPLELAVDNFSEVEHTPMTHQLFGYDIQRMATVQLTIEAHDDRLHCQTAGRHQPIPFWLRLVFGVGKEVDFTSEWDTFYSPVHLAIDHVLTNVDSGKAARLQYRAYVLFAPIDNNNTKIFTVLYVQSRYPGPQRCVRVMRPFIKRFAAHEVELDCVKLRDLADKNPDLTGLKLSRFDRLLLLNRHRINRIYRGIESSESEKLAALSADAGDATSLPLDVQASQFVTKAQ